MQTARLTAAGVALCVVTLAESVFVQSPVPGVIHASEGQFANPVEWLRSRDPRQQAWGAWISGRNLLREGIPDLERVVTDHLGQSTLEASAATDVALDALIELDAAVSVGLIRRVFEERPDQALVLLSKQRQDTGDFLNELVRREAGVPWFAAANLALERRVDGFAAAVLHKLQLMLHVTVTDGETEDSFGVFGGGGVAIGCGGSGLAIGLPPWPTYRLTVFGRSGDRVLAQGPKPVYYQRQVAPAGDTPAASSLSIDGPSADERLQYLAVLIGLDKAQLGLRGDEWRQIVWRDAAAFEEALEQLRDDTRWRYNGLLSSLVAYDALTEREARESSVPQLTIVLTDQRRTKTPALGPLRRN